jgi:AcrR family transcriptional regulator
MNMRFRHPPEETRRLILDIADEHFRRIGYAKTAVADIAGALGMSPANVYRFFPSKAAINEAICGRLLDEMHAVMTGVAAGPGRPDERLRSLILTMNAFHKERLMGEKRLHDMVEVAMQENWPAISEHLAFVVRTFAGLIAEGIAAGIFRPVADVPATALTFKQCCISVLHPSMIESCERHGMVTEDQAERISAFVIDALRAERN